MAQALIRNLDDAVAADYKAAAKANGRSYEAELRDMLVRNRPITRLNAAGRRALGDDLAARSKPSADSADLLREAREYRFSQIV